ncbi:MAG: hypothetical protein ACTHNU_03030 [Gaiellales bacterium]
MAEEPHTPADPQPDAADERGAGDPRQPLDAPAVPFLGRRSGSRRRIESLFVRLVATSGIIGLSVAVAAILGTQSVRAWVIGLVASVMSVVLAALLWSSRTL